MRIWAEKGEYQERVLLKLALHVHKRCVLARLSPIAGSVILRNSLFECSRGQLDVNVGEMRVQCRLRLCVWGVSAEIRRHAHSVRINVCREILR